MLKGLNDFLDKHEGREVGSSTRAINKERARQGYKAIHEKKHEVAKKMGGEKKPRLHWGTKNFTASNPSYHKAPKGKGSLTTPKGEHAEGEKHYLGKRDNEEQPS